MKISEKTKKRGYLLIIAAAVAAMVWLGFEYHISRKDAPAAITFSEPPKVVKTSDNKVLVSVSTETIRDGLANMGALITQEYYFTQVERYTKEKTVLRVLPSTSEFVYSYDGAVQAGIDFTQIQINKNDSTKTIRIILPKSEIQSVTIDKDTFKTYSEKESLWNPLKLEDYNISLKEFEIAAKKKALDNGILDRSDAEAKTLVQNFISNFPAAADYQIIFG